MSTIPHNLESLKDGNRAFWKTLTPEKCRRYINHMHTVIPKVIEKGAASGYQTLSLINIFSCYLLSLLVNSNFHPQMLDNGVLCVMELSDDAVGSNLEIAFPLVPGVGKNAVELRTVLSRVR